MQEKENPSLVFSGDREIPTRGSIVPVGNEAKPSSHWNGGPSGLDFLVPLYTMIDSISHISNKTLYYTLAGHCCLPLATYCKVCHTRSDVRGTKTFLKKLMLEVSSEQFKTFTSLQFRLSAVIAW